MFTLAVDNADALCSFLIKAHHNDLHHRYRMRYEDNPDFNEYLDEITEWPTVDKVSLSPSKSLFTDIEAYKESLDRFWNSPQELIQALDVTGYKDILVDRIGTINSLFKSEDIVTLSELVKKQQEEYTKTYEILSRSFDFKKFEAIAKSLQPVIDSATKATKEVVQITKKVPKL